MLTKKYLNELTYAILGACIEVHKHLGPGLLESVYHKCLSQEFRLRKMRFSSEQKIEINYKGIDVMDAFLRYDFLIEDTVLLEIKSIENIMPIHQAQILSYMKLQEKPKGVIVNFNVTNIFKEGQRTFVNEHFKNLPEE